MSREAKVHNPITRAVEASGSIRTLRNRACRTEILWLRRWRTSTPTLTRWDEAAQIEIASLPTHSAENLSPLRAVVQDLPIDVLPYIRWERNLIPGSGDQPPVLALLINAKLARKHHGIVHLHGGEFVYGSALMNLEQNQKIASTAGAVILSVDDQWGPGTRFRHDFFRRLSEGRI